MEGRLLFNWALLLDLTAPLMALTVVPLPLLMEGHLDSDLRQYMIPTTLMAVSNPVVVVSQMEKKNE